MNENLKHIINNYAAFEKELVAQLNYSAEHPGTAGSYREEIWKSLFERIVPKKFKIERSVFIMDSFGNFSNEVDLAIFDEQYTPYVFNYGKIKFIPIEAVAAVIECKSKNSKNEYNILKNWIESINKLKTSGKSISRTMSGISFENVATQASTSPIKILCYISDTKIERIPKGTLDMKFDIVIEVKENINNESSKGLFIHFEHKNLYKWFEIINHKGIFNIKKVDGTSEYKKNLEAQLNKLKKYDIEKDYQISDNGENIPTSLLSFIFQFNQLLMLLNNPMFFPHKAYVDLFNGKRQEK